VTRHWPPAALDDHADPVVVAEEVARIIERHVTAVIANRPAYLPLTAGHDSRTLLACARSCIDRVHLFTLALPDRTARVDVAMARQLARRHGLRYQVVDCEPPDAEELDAWLWRSGLCVGRADGGGGLRRSIPPVRASHWRDLGGDRLPLTEHTIVRALTLPLPDILVRARKWLMLSPPPFMHVVDLYT
jgi:hypothetical protein